MQTKLTILALLCFQVSSVYAHHFKGLPHYGYFENYPQTPIEEYLGQSGDFEFYLVVYDFQGLEKKKVNQPDDLRLFLNVYDLRKDKAYNGTIWWNVLNNGEEISPLEEKEAEQESLFYLNHRLPPNGDYALQAVVKGEKNARVVIPFQLSSQKKSWGLWLAVILLLLIVVAAFGSRKMKIIQDRKLERNQAHND